MTHLVELVLGIGDDITLQWSTAVGLGNLQRIKSEDLALGVLTEVFCLGSPAQLTLSGEDLSGDVAVDDFVDISGIAGVGIADNSESWGTGWKTANNGFCFRAASLAAASTALSFFLASLEARSAAAALVVSATASAA